jgi:1-deoxy-D-xylulose-5-phosphate synthase
MILPDRFIDQDKPDLMYAAAGLNAEHIVEKALSALGMDDAVIADVLRQESA